MTGRLQDKALVIVGAGTGIGAATARRLVSEGARVVLTDINLDAAQAVAAELGAAATALPIDIADEASVNTAMADAVQWLGGLDGIHINAADLRTIFADSDALSLDLAVFDRTMAVNLRGHLLCTRAALPHLLARGGGAVVYTTSGASHSAEPQRPSYAMSKSGLNALMRHVASRWGREGVRSNCVAPGFVMTPEMIAGGQVPEQLITAFLARTPSTRVGQAEDIAGVAAMLLSSDGQWINGQVIHVNGGGLMPA